MDQPNPTPTNQTPSPVTVVKTSPSLISPNSIGRIGADQNLIDPGKVVTSEEAPGVWKSIILDTFSVFFAGALGYCFAEYLGGGLAFWWVFGAFLLWGTTSVLEGFLQPSSRRRFWVICAESFVLVVFFYGYDWSAIAIAGVIALLCMLWGYLSMRREVRNTIQIRFFTASGKMISKIMTSAIIFMIIMYGSIASGGQGSLFMSENSFNTFFTWAAGFVKDFYPTIPLTGSFGDFAQALAEMQVQGNPQFQALTPSEQSTVLSQSADQLMASFSSNPTSTATSTSVAEATQPASNVFYNYLSSMVGRLQVRFGASFIAVWGLILFLALRSIGIIAIWIGQFVAVIFYELLLATGFMKITEESITKEKIGY